MSTNTLPPSGDIAPELPDPLEDIPAENLVGTPFTVLGWSAVQEYVQDFVFLFITTTGDAASAVVWLSVRSRAARTLRDLAAKGCRSFVARHGFVRLAELNDYDFAL